LVAEGGLIVYRSLKADKEDLKSWMLKLPGESKQL